MTRTPLLLLVLLLLSSAAAPASRAEEGAVEVWDQPRAVVAHLVQNDTTLVVRGVPVTIEVGLVVAPRGRLVLEPGPDGAPAELRAGDADGWAALVQGEMVADSRGGEPAVLEGIGGEATASKDTLLLTGGFTVAGRVEADGIIVRGYTAAFSLAPNGTLVLRNATFESERGMAVAATHGRAEVADATFRGPGAGAWVAASGVLRVARATFEDVPLPVTHLGDEAVLEDVVARNATAGCVRASKGSLVVRGLSCEGFQKSGIDVARPTQGIGRPRADLSGLRLTSGNATAPAVFVDGAEAVSVADSVLGPVGGHGIDARGVQPALRNVTFRGVGGYNHHLLNVGAPLRAEGLAEGEPGAKGHAYVGAHFSLRALGADGEPAERARVEVRLEPEDVRIAHAVLPETGRSEPFVLDVLQVDREGRRHAFSYHVVARDAEGAHGWERAGYVPDGSPLLFQMVDPVARQSTPLPSLPIALLALTLVAWVWVGRGRSG